MMIPTRTLLSLLMLIQSIVPSISSSSTLISESSTRLPMSLSTVISDLEAEGVANVTTACLVTSRSVTMSKRASLLESLFGFDDTDIYNTAFGKKVFDDDDDGIVVAHPGSQAPAAEVASTVVACGGTVVYAPSPYDLARGEGLFDTLAPAMEKLMTQKSQDTTPRKAVLVVVVADDDVTTAKSQLEQAASPILSNLVQPGSSSSTGGTRKALVLEDVFDTVEYVSSSMDKEHFEDMLCHLGGACEPSQATASVTSTVMGEISLASAMAYMTSMPPLTTAKDVAAARQLGPASRAALETAMTTVTNICRNDDTGEAQLVSNFGELADATVTHAMEELKSDDMASPVLQQSAIARQLRSNLKEELYAELSDVYEEQLKELQVASFEDFRRRLSQLKITPLLATEMDNVVNDCCADFAKAAKKLQAKGSSWSAAAAAKAGFKKKLQEFKVDRLLVARASGQFRPAPRKGVTVGLHWLLPKPFGNDYRQEPWTVNAVDNLVFVPKDKITDVSPEQVKTDDWRNKIVPVPSGNEMIYM